MRPMDPLKSRSSILLDDEFITSPSTPRLTSQYFGIKSTEITTECIITKKKEEKSFENGLLQAFANESNNCFPEYDDNKQSDSTTKESCIESKITYSEEKTCAIEDYTRVEDNLSSSDNRGAFPDLTSSSLISQNTLHTSELFSNHTKNLVQNWKEKFQFKMSNSIDSMKWAPAVTPVKSAFSEAFKNSPMSSSKRGSSSKGMTAKKTFLKAHFNEGKVKIRSENSQSDLKTIISEQPSGKENKFPQSFVFQECDSTPSRDRLSKFMFVAGK